LSAERAEFLIARLDALGQAARVFGSGLADVDVHLGWSLAGDAEEVRWVDPQSGRPRVRVQLDLSRMIELLYSAADDPETRYLDAFKAGFLHELGHILYSGRSLCTFTDPAEDPFACVALDEEQAALAALPGVQEVLRQICLTLEDARVEQRLTGVFRGARRFLEGHAERVLAIAHGGAPGIVDPSADLDGASVDHLERLVAVLFLQVRGLDGRIETANVPISVLRSAERLRGSLSEVIDAEGPQDLASWVVRRLLPEIRGHLKGMESSGSGDSGQTYSSDEPDMHAPFVDGPERGPADGSTGTRTGVSDASGEGTPIGTPDSATIGRLPEDSGADLRGAGAPLPSLSRDMEQRFAAPDLLLSGGRGHRIASAESDDRTGPLESQIIVFPHSDGRMVLDELSVADATNVRRTDRAREVARDVLEIYGPMAVAAFAGEAASLRRAFQVNYERRLGGRYRSGKRVGISNIRRFITSDDLRLFQRIEVPERLSYYFHLLVDVSPSMLTNKNAQKAVATAYAFADALDRLRVPVDVTLYSSAVTVLYDHRTDTLDRFFGGEFGYLSSGTHEIEAIAYAKLRADSVVEERKVIVVVTDGQPNSLALSRAGAANLREYYRLTLTPWLTRAHIDLMAIGIGMHPSYHGNSVSVSSSWDSIGVLMRLLDEIIARGQRSHSSLWA